MEPPNPFDLVGDLVGTIKSTISDLRIMATAVAKEPAMRAILGILHTVFVDTDKSIEHMLKHPGDIGSWYEMGSRDMGSPFVKAFMQGGLGVDPDYSQKHKLGFGMTAPHGWDVNPKAFASDSTQGINELRRIIGFILGTNLLSAGVAAAIKWALSERYPDAVDRMIGTIGEQLGLGWASGTAISSIFDAAAMPSILETVNVQLHPNRLDMPTLTRLVKQHHITKDQFWAGMELQGFPDDLKTLILELDTSQLTPADLSALWGIGYMSRHDVQKYLENLGYSDKDVRNLLTLWIDHAESQELQQYKAVLKADYIEGKIGPDVYRDMLAQLLQYPLTPPSLPVEGTPNYDHAPDQIRIVVDMAKSVADFSLKYGRTTLSVATLGKQLKVGEISGDQFRTAVEALGYSASDAVALLHTYQQPPLAGKPALTTAKILQYTKSGVLSSSQAYTKLVQLGMNTKDAEFLAYNPSASQGPWGFPQNVATVRQAYLDQVLDNDTAGQQLKVLGLDSTEILEALTLWHYQLTHPVDTLEHLKANTVWLAQYRESLKPLYMVDGGLGDAETVALLEDAGLTETDAYYTWAGWYALKYGKAPINPPGFPGAGGR